MVLHQLMLIFKLVFVRFLGTVFGWSTVVALVTFHFVVVVVVVMMTKLVLVKRNRMLCHIFANVMKMLWGIVFLTNVVFLVLLLLMMLVLLKFLV